MPLDSFDIDEQRTAYIKECMEIMSLGLSEDEKAERINDIIQEYIKLRKGHRHG